MIFFVNVLAFSSMFLKYETSFAKPNAFVGYFEESNEVAVKQYSKKECLKYEGQFRKNMCWLDIRNSIDIKEKAPNQFKVSIRTAGNHGHDCAFDGEGQLSEPKTLMSQEGECKVEIKLLSSKIISSKETLESKCSCGINTSLNISKAKRIK